MTSIKKILLAGAGAGLLAFSAAPVLAAGPMMSTPKSDATVEKVEYRWNGYRWVWFDPPRPNYYAPYYGQQYNAPPYGRAWGYRHHTAPPPYGHAWGYHDNWPADRWDHRYWNQPIR